MCLADAVRLNKEDWLKSLNLDLKDIMWFFATGSTFFKSLFIKSFIWLFQNVITSKKTWGILCFIKPLAFEKYSLHNEIFVIKPGRIISASRECRNIYLCFHFHLCWSLKAVKYLNPKTYSDHAVAIWVWQFPSEANAAYIRQIVEHLPWDMQKSQNPNCSLLPEEAHIVHWRIVHVDWGTDSLFQGSCSKSESRQAQQS